MSERSEMGSPIGVERWNARPGEGCGAGASVCVGSGTFENVPELCREVRATHVPIPICPPPSPG